MDHLCYLCIVFFLLSSLFIAALWSSGIIIFWFTLQTSDYDVIIDDCADSAPLATSFKKWNVIMT